MERSDRDQSGLVDAASVDPAYVRMYFDHQYDRFAKLEQHGFTVSNLVIGLCVLGFGFLVSGSPAENQSVRPIFVLLMVAINIVAVAYLARVYFAKHSHQRRAKEVLRRYAMPLLKIDGEVPQPNPRSPFKRSFIQAVFHVIIAGFSLSLL